MPKYLVEITETAAFDLREIFHYISADSAGAAKRFLNVIERQIGSLEQFPGSCPVIPESRGLGRQYRHIIHGEYRTIFNVDGPRAVIMRAIHGDRLLDMEMFEKQTEKT